VDSVAEHNLPSFQMQWKKVLKSSTCSTLYGKPRERLRTQSGINSVTMILCATTMTWTWPNGHFFYDIAWILKLEKAARAILDIVKRFMHYVERPMD